MKESIAKIRQPCEKFVGDEMICWDGTYGLYRKCFFCKTPVDRWWKLVGKSVCSDCKNRMDAHRDDSGRRKFTFTGPVGGSGSLICVTCETMVVEGYIFEYGWQCELCISRKLVPAGHKGAFDAVQERRLYERDPIRTQRAAGRNSGNGFGRFLDD